MKHEEAEDLLRNIVAFQRITRKLASLELSFDWDMTEESCYYDDRFPIRTPEGPCAVDHVAIKLRLRLSGGDAGQPTTSLEMDFYDSGSQGPTIWIEHQSGCWSIYSDAEGGWISSETREDQLFKDALTLFSLRVGETKKVTEEQAFEAIRVMVKFFQMLKAANAAPKQSA